MKDKKIGGIILYSEKMADNSIKIGNITFLERIILNYQQVGLDPIVIVSDVDVYYLVEHLKKYPIIYLRSDSHQGTIDLLKTGIDYLSSKCHALFFTTAVVPMFTADTICKVITTEGELISPSYQHKSGHPILIRESLYPKFLESRLSLKNTIRDLVDYRVFVNIEDSGVISSIDNRQEIQNIVEEHTQQLLSETVSVGLERERKFFDERTKLLLILLNEMKTMGKACEHMALSKRKAWDILNEMEEELGFKVVHRRHGGKAGGSTELTEEGKNFLNHYLELENDIKRYARKRFEILFDKYTTDNSESIK